MGRTYAQATPTVLDYSASLAAAASISASRSSIGYSRLVGVMLSSASSAAGCSLLVDQSPDGGTNWNQTTACDLSTDSGSGFSIEIVGDAVRVRFVNGADSASTVRALWQLRPIG